MNPILKFFFLAAWVWGGARANENLNFKEKKTFLAGRGGGEGAGGGRVNEFFSQRIQI